jgi:hypothetical protein
LAPDVRSHQNLRSGWLQTPVTCWWTAEGLPAAALAMVAWRAHAASPTRSLPALSGPVSAMTWMAGSSPHSGWPGSGLKVQPVPSSVQAAPMVGSTAAALRAFVPVQRMLGSRTRAAYSRGIGARLCHWSATRIVRDGACPLPGAHRVVLLRGLQPTGVGLAGCGESPSPAHVVGGEALAGAPRPQDLPTFRTLRAYSGLDHSVGPRGWHACVDCCRGVATPATCTTGT